MVPGAGLEPTKIAPADFKSAASANSATPAADSCYFTPVGKEISILIWRRRADSNRRIGILQTPALTTWPRRPAGAEDEIRTRDPLLGKEMLYR